VRAIELRLGKIRKENNYKIKIATIALVAMGNAFPN
jgi:hypothetical protein